MALDPAERAEQTVALLWRHRADRRARPGPRPGRSLDELVAAGIDLADAEGLPALTVRRLAERVGLSRMAVYGYVTDLDQLTELMIDSVHSEVFAPPARFPYRSARRRSDPRTSWRRAARTVAETNLGLIGRHRWLISRPNDRPVLGPHSTAKYDAELAALDGLGLTDPEIDLALWQLLNHVGIAAQHRFEAEQRDATGATGTQDWWQAGGPAAARWITDEEFPRAVRVGTAAGQQQDTAYDPEASYRFGLDRILDGLQLLIDDRNRERH